MTKEDKIMRKLKCKCGGYFQSKYTNEELLKKYPFIENDTSLKNLRYISMFIKYKRRLECPDCGRQKKISKKLLIEISKMVSNK